MDGRPSETLSIGDAAPDFTLPGTGGDAITRSTFQGSSTLVLMFFRGTW